MKRKILFFAMATILFLGVAYNSYSEEKYEIRDVDSETELPYYGKTYNFYTGIKITANNTIIHYYYKITCICGGPCLWANLFSDGGSYVYPNNYELVPKFRVTENSTNDMIRGFYLYVSCTSNDQSVTIHRRYKIVQNPKPED